MPYYHSIRIRAPFYSIPFSFAAHRRMAGHACMLKYALKSILSSAFYVYRAHLIQQYPALQSLLPAFFQPQQMQQKSTAVCQHAVSAQLLNLPHKILKYQPCAASQHLALHRMQNLLVEILLQAVALNPRVVQK